MTVRKFEFICMNEKCLKDGQSPCVISIYGEEVPEYPSYCPWEFEPAEHKYMPWRLLK